MPERPTLRFDRADYSGTPQPLLGCAWCGRTIEELHFEVYSRPTCDLCGRQALSQLPENSTRTYLRSSAYGVVAALAAGLVLILAEHALPAGYWETTAVLMAIAVGAGITSAMRAAGRGARGRRYQLTGAFLAYAAVVLPLQGFLVGFREDLGWLYPFVLLRPLGWLFTDLRSIGAAELFAACIAMTWTWRRLKQPPVAVRQLQGSALKN